MYFHCVKFCSILLDSLGAFADLVNGAEETGIIIIIRIVRTGVITIKIPMNIGIFN